MSIRVPNHLVKAVVAVALVAAIFSLVPSGCRGAELDRRQRAMVLNLSSTINRANKNLFEQKISQAETDLRKALDQVNRILESDSPELFDAIDGHIKALSKTHAMLELEGASLPPFRKPSRPTATSDSKPMSPDGMAGDLVSFKDDVAPILSAKCGSCHVNRSQGRFSLASYAVLMKGPPEGVVVFAGDVVGSRLIETIETGDMPRGGGRVSPEELKTLKDWVLQGAKFDGEDPNATIAGAGTTREPAMAAAPTPTITKASGGETVSFAAEVAPLLVENCSGCHIDAMQTRGGLEMDQFARLLRGGDSGPVITPGRGEASLLIQKLRGTAADGARMPVGRPPLSDQSIALISKWIDEGAKLDAEERQPIKVMARMAWVANATSAEVSSRRAELADRNLKLAGSGPAEEHHTEHFRVIGPTTPATLELVGRQAENNLTIAKTVVKASSGNSEDYFHGKATIFVLPKRYDYSEFAKMVERRSIPSDWASHWSYNVEDAYLVTVATGQDDEEAIEDRLLSPVISLAVASRGSDVPRWFAEGLGSARAMQQTAKSRADQAKLRTKIAEAASSVKNAKAFLENRLTPEQADAFGTAIAMTMLDRNRRKSLDATFRLLSSGQPFERAFVGGFRVSPTVYIDQLLSYAR
ncbi:c-type cytochrome domain-containing protein [Roseiconus lacunae]|uniref:c-type cytochrome domain-containing protein n=1 Tax=Roseiconus lacunae TaxID=2605694 RepID=UPI001E454094|nr:c-type cytochrome domain-containing protein [Roseiconus lacunae]MCD0460907.1 hypothetical protein [Roseiconus lacunae]